MAAPTFDLSGLVLLEQVIPAMVAQGNANFVGGQTFNVTYSASTAANQLNGPATMTTAQLQQRLIALRALFDKLAL